MKIEHLGLSPAHRYFGHHGGPAGSAGMAEVDAVECVAGLGLRGDRFFNYKTGYKGQVSFFAMEVFEAVCAELGVHGVSPLAARRNVVTRGIDLNGLIGREFVMQGVRFKGIEECRPCHWMDQAIGPGADARLRGCGGLRAHILEGGCLRIGAAAFRSVAESSSGEPVRPVADPRDDSSSGRAARRQRE